MDNSFLYIGPSLVWSLALYIATNAHGRYRPIGVRAGRDNNGYSL